MQKLFNRIDYKAATVVREANYDRRFLFFGTVPMIPSSSEAQAQLPEHTTNVQHFRNGEAYTLLPITDENVPDNSYTAAIAAICNEPPIYDLLFAERCAGAPYATADAERFLNWARRGWREQTHFVYLLCDSNGNPAGAIDIKSADRNSAEIGYWLGKAHYGIMTNAVTALCNLARGAGYVSLHALVRITNERSANVLHRAGFLLSTRFPKNNTLYDRWESSLTQPTKHL